MRDLSNKLAKTRNEVEYAFLEGGAADEGVGEGHERGWRMMRLRKVRCPLGLRAA